MPSYKNQHFVPQSYLRQFSIPKNSSAISIFNIDREKVIRSASIKKQCSKNYFYGEDLYIEKAFHPVESKYSAIVRVVSDNNYNIFEEEHKQFLKHFWLIQYMRTEAASKRHVEMSNSLIDGREFEDEEVHNYQLSIDDAVKTSMKVLTKSLDVIDDLKGCLISNKTQLDFITSDDPAVITNRWHLQYQGNNPLSYGLGSSGIIVFLPLSPKLMFMAYDGDVYSIVHQKGIVAVKNLEEVMAFNQHQLLNCNGNVFFNGQENSRSVVELYQAIKDRRPPSRHKVTYAVHESTDNGYKRYRVVDEKEAENYEKVLVHISTEKIYPINWPSILRWRNKGCAYTDNSATGFIRKSRIVKEGLTGFKKVSLK